MAVLNRGKRTCPRLLLPARWRVVVFITATLLAGCHPFARAPREPNPSNPSVGDTASDAAEKTSDASASLLSIMRQGTWVWRIARPGQTLGADSARWRHPDLEDLLARPLRQRPDFGRWLGHDDPVVAGNAAIALARAHDRRAAEPLADAVRHPTLEMSMRRAAAEAFIPLGQADRDGAADLVRELLVQYGDFRSTAHSRYLSEIHAELIRAHAQLQPDDTTPLVEALESPAVVVRLDALKSWPNTLSEPLPTKVAEMCSDVATPVRAEALRLVAAFRAPRAHDLLVRGLRDHEIQVRLAAIDGLGKLGGTSSLAVLKSLLKNHSATIRAATVATLAQMGAWPEVFTATEDPAWQVRKAVAAVLRADPHPRAAKVVAQFLDDASSQVGQQAVETLGQWPLAKAGPLLLSGMEATSLAVRKASTATLADRWGPARPFPYDAQPDRRAKALAELKQSWLAEHGNPPPAVPADRPNTLATVPADVRRQIEAQIDQLSDRTTPRSVCRQIERALVEQGPSAVAVFDAIAIGEQRVLPPEIYHHVLPELDPAFSMFLQLESSSASERRRAAASLVDATRGTALSDLALVRLVELITTEKDPLVWASIETALLDDVRQPALDLHYAAMSHPAPEVRRRACQYLSARGDPAHQDVLLAALADNSPSVVLAAAEALAQTGQLKNSEPLVRLLSRRDPQLRLAAGTSLAKLGLDRGEATLQRLAHSDNAKIRRKTAEAMGEVGSSVFVPTLIHLLADRLGIKRAALKSLEQIVGRDIAAVEPGPPANLDEQIARWRRWHTQQ